MRLSVEDFKIGAIYRVASKRLLPQAEAAALLARRTNLSEAKSAQLAAHWFAGPLRETRQCSTSKRLFPA